MFVKNITETTQKIRIDWVETEIGAWEVFQTTESKAEELVRNYPSIIGYASIEDVSESGELAELKDVDITNPQEWDVLSYDGDKFVNKEPKGNKIQDKTILFIGDSYGDSNSIQNPRYPLVISKLGLTKVYRLTTGGHGFTGKDGATSGTTWPQLRRITDLTTFVGAHTEKELADIDIVCIVWGFNDNYSTQATIKSYMSAFFTYAKEHLPNAEFMLWFAWRADQVASLTTPNLTVSWDNMRRRLRAVKQVYETCGVYGCKYMGDLNLTLHQYWVDFDNTKYHPSSAWAEKLATAICNCLVSWSFNVSMYEIPQVFTKTVNETDTEVTCFYATQRDDHIQVHNTLNVPTALSTIVQGTTAKAINRWESVVFNGQDMVQKYVMKSWLYGSKSWSGSLNLVWDLFITWGTEFIRCPVLITTWGFLQFQAPCDIATDTNISLRIRGWDSLADLC